MKRIVKSRRVLFVISVAILLLFTFSKNDTISIESKRKTVTSEIIVESPDYDFEEKKTYVLNDIRGLLGISETDTLRTGFSVAIIDSGVYPHNAFVEKRDKIVAFKDFVYGKANLYDDSGHGTAVAGIIAGETNDEEQIGIAPFVDIVALKVLNNYNKGDIHYICDAINWAIDNKDLYNIRIINISIGIEKDEKKMIENACAKAYENGIIIVTSAGNCGDELKKYVIAEQTSVVAVGSIDYEDDGISIAEYSQSWHSEKKSVPNIYTVGTNISVPQSNTLYKGTDSEEIKEENDYEIVTGTSFSTAIVTGYVCHLIKNNPESSVSEILSLLFENNQKVFDNKLNCYVPVLGK